MPHWQPHREPLRDTIARTVGIAIVAGGIVALSAGALRRWPVISLLLLWPAFGGHWVDLLFLNWARPRLSENRAVQWLARLALWFVGGVVLAVGVQLTARALLHGAALTWLTWGTAGAVFIGTELVAHAALQLRGRPNFYNGLG
jgi:hypothetical protein